MLGAHIEHRQSLLANSTRKAEKKSAHATFFGKNGDASQCLVHFLIYHFEMIVKDCSVLADFLALTH